jgi:RND family efflux transporter MFP subunit
MFRLSNTIRTLVTGLLILVILAAIYALWLRYQVEPLTRDGKVRADIVAVAADVSGLVADVFVHDNETVKKGQVLFRIDPVRFELALRQAEANADNRRAALAEAVRESNRYHSLTALSVSREKQEQTATAVEQATAAYQLALADRDTAKLNLDRSSVTASVPGLVTNFDLLPGNYATAGHAVVALVATDTIRVEGYFEETKLPAVHVGDPASIYLMGVANEIKGHVESIAGGVEDRERAGGEAQLANVNPSFTWVRLAQRIPVRIVIDHVPPGLRLVPGQTATVEVHSRPDEVTIVRSLPW